MARARKTSNELFDRFWTAYPRKESKPQAIRTFDKLKIDEKTLERILKELDRQAKMKDWQHINIKYIPMASTWLNRKDWENGTNEFSDTGDFGTSFCTVLR